ncbi:olfactory receptor class A-like protein 1 [Rhinoderma darwinii]|uniref:olfactory receptor class A-like protein 1 n=1 Tax=Rhinoderma darwinii TaxID=43563 RepID=UPI003F6805D6
MPQFWNGIPVRQVSQPLSGADPSSPAYSQFADVFSKKEAEELPPDRAYDCPIELVPDASLPRGRMLDIRLALKAFGFFMMMVIGIPGNVYILLKFTLIRLCEKKLLPANTILMALVLMNLLIVLSRIIPQYLHAIGLEHLMDDTRCQLFIYTYRVSRAMSICITSLLSCHQCILIAPSSKYWLYFKQKITHSVLTIIITIFCFNLVLYYSAIEYAQSNYNSTTSIYSLHLIYCDMDYLTYYTYIVNGAIFAFRDFLFVGLMVLASSYIVYRLQRHKRLIKGIRSSDKGQGRSVEYIASRAVIFMVILYVVLFGLDNSMWIYTLTLSNVTANMNDARIILACSYSALSPIVIISTNPKLHQHAKNFQMRTSLLWNHQKIAKRNVQVSCVSK